MSVRRSDPIPRKAAKKLSLVVGPLRGWEEVKAGSQRKITFLTVFFIVSQSIYIFYFHDFTILLNYVVGWQSRSLLAGFLQYLANNMALFGRQKIVKFVFGKALLVAPLTEELFCGFPKRQMQFFLAINYSPG